MVPIRALWFLSFRTWLNAIIRSVSMPRRVLGVAVTLLALITGFAGRAIAIAAGSNVSRAPIRMPLPEGWVDWVPHGAFLLFAVPTLLMLAGALSLPSVYKRADADVMFATPIPPKVLLVLLVLRSQGRALFFAGLAMVTYLLRRHPLFEPIAEKEVTLALVGEMGFYLSLAVFLTALLKRTICYSIALYVARDDVPYERPRRAVHWLAGTSAIILVGSVPAIVFVPGLQPLALAALKSDWARVLFPIGTLGQWIATGIPLRQPGLFVAGMVTTICLIVLMGAVMLRQSSWLTDIATRTAILLGADEARETLSMSHQRELGANVKRGRWRRWWGARSLPAHAAIIWRSLLTTPATLIFYGGVLGSLTIAPLFMPLEKLSGAFGPMLGLLFFGGSTQLSPVGQILNRIDLCRALPFTTRGLLLSEIASRAVPFTVFGLLLNLIWGLERAIPLEAAMMATPIFLGSVALWNTDSTLVLTLFPDMNDKTQSQVRGLTSLGILIGTFGAYYGLIAGLTFLVQNGILVAWCVTIPTLVGCWIAFGVIANMFDNINPAE